MELWLTHKCSFRNIRRGNLAFLQQWHEAFFTVFSMTVWLGKRICAKFYQRTYKIGIGKTLLMDFRDLVTAWSCYIDSRLISAIQQLRQNGFICCLATSQEYNRAKYMKTEMGFQNVFDHLFFSCEQDGKSLILLFISTLKKCWIWRKTPFCFGTI